MMRLWDGSLDECPDNKMAEAEWMTGAPVADGGVGSARWTPHLSILVPKSYNGHLSIGEG